jgi:hypothetical protein
MTELFVVDGSSIEAARKSMADFARIAEEGGAALPGPPVLCNTMPPPSGVPARLSAEEVIRANPGLTRDLLKAVSRAHHGDYYEADALYDELVARMEGEPPQYGGRADLPDPLDPEAPEPYYRGARSTSGVGSRGDAPRLILKAVLPRRWRYLDRHPMADPELNRTLRRFRPTPRLVLA